jgi:acetate kinase
MNILIINSGSSSLKYQLFNADTEVVLCKGLVDRIGIDGSKIKHEDKTGKKSEHVMPLANHTEALEKVLTFLTDKEIGGIDSLDAIGAVGHRVVHGGEKYSDSVLIDDEVLADIIRLSDLAPLHNPANVVGIEACRRLLKNIPNIAVFDTAFHATMEQEAYLYAIPREYYEKYGIRRYGFHGPSHKFVSERAAEIL